MRSYAQELNATVTINTQQIDASLRPRFETLKQSLEEFINGQQWTGAQFSNVEKITCTFALTINEVVQSDVYKVSITVQARRPVYNATYQTILINWRDDVVTLPYQEGENLTYNEFNLDNELIATIAYYVYLVLGLDFDSFSSMGGEQYLRKCESIVSQMQSSDSNGWKAFDFSSLSANFGTPTIAKASTRWHNLSTRDAHRSPHPSSSSPPCAQPTP